MQWQTLFKKEILEHWRTKKWLWVPLVFILLAVMDPIVNYYMDDILKMTGGLPEGTIIEFPDFTALEGMMMSIAQLSSLGVFFLALLTMGTISSEIKSGVTEVILVKPVSYTSYITTKFVSWVLLITSSLFISLLASWYYVSILYGDISFQSILLVILFYSLWYIFIIALSLFYNTFIHSPFLVGFLTIGSALGLSGISTLLNRFMKWSPSEIINYLPELLTNGTVSKDLWMTSIVSIIIILILILLSIIVFDRKEKVAR